MSGQQVGYLRVSTLLQNTAHQLDGVVLDRVFEDKASGKDTARPQLAECLAFLREGDMLHVHSMDRLARNLDDLRRCREGSDRAWRARPVRQGRAVVYG
jgi:DNA invertase Pin-like site-specific DNA recombinase